MLLGYSPDPCPRGPRNLPGSEQSGVYVGHWELEFPCMGMNFRMAPHLLRRQTSEVRARDFWAKLSCTSRLGAKETAHKI